MVLDFYNVNVEILYHNGCVVIVPVMQKNSEQEKAA
jgi:predicted glycosyltransferase